MDYGSDRAGAVIAFLDRNKFLSPKEKLVLLKNCPFRKITTRLLCLAFHSEIFRADIEKFVKKQTTELHDADERLSRFVAINEAFFQGKISGQDVIEEYYLIFRRVHVREFQFYKDLLSGGTCYLDFLTFQKSLPKKDRDNTYIRFMRPCDANPDYAWGGKQYIIQPNYQGVPMRVILEKGKNPVLIGRDQQDYTNRYAKTLKLASEWIENSKYRKVEFDAILARKDKKDFPSIDWKGKDHILWVYDYLNMDLPLKKRIKTVKSLCLYMQEKKNTRIQAMPTEIVTGAMIPKYAKSYSMAHNPYVSRNGIIVKRWDSPYVFGRSPDWMCLTSFNDTVTGNSLGRATLMGLHPSSTKVFALTNNNMEIEINCSQTCFDYIGKYMGYTIEYGIFPEHYSFRRTLFLKGREV